MQRLSAMPRNVFFNGHSTAASATITKIGGGLLFRDQSTADHAFISNNNLFINGSLNNFGTIVFGGNGAPTSAGNSTIQNNAGFVLFNDGSNAANANIVNDAGHLNFTDNSTAGSSTITNINGGVILFHGPNPTAGQARVIMDSSSSFDISDIFQLSMTVGSIEGSGGVSLGSKQLLIGTNNLSTEFGGSIFGVGGSLSEGWHRHADPHWHQHLHWRDHHQCRHSPARQWRNEWLDRRQRHQQQHLRHQPLGRLQLWRCRFRNRRVPAERHRHHHSHSRQHLHRRNQC